MSSKTKKERKIKTITNIFTAENGIMSNVEILHFFERTLNLSMSRAGSYPERLVRVGATHERLDLSLGVSGDTRGRGSVYNVYLPEFSQKALTEIDNYRIIYSFDTEGIYRVIVDFVNDPGIYLITYDREPQFKIEISPTRYIAGQMTFKQCRGGSTFKCLHELDERPRKLTIETSVAQRAEGDKEKLVKKLFLDFHEKLGQKYIGRGMTPAEE